MNIFTPTLRGFFGDKFGIKLGLEGRVMFMGGALLLEGLALILFSRMATLFLAVGAMISFSLFVQMSEGATFSVFPFINRRALASVTGIVGAGGNAGAVAACFLFPMEGITFAGPLLIIRIVVEVVVPLAFLARFSPQQQAEERIELEGALGRRKAQPDEVVPAPAD